MAIGDPEELRDHSENPRVRRFLEKPLLDILKQLYCSMLNCLFQVAEETC